MNKDDKDKYIKQLEDKIATLEARIEELERLLGINSQNSSKPPSSDGPEVPKFAKRGKVRRKRGAKKGHKPHIRKMYPPEEVTEFIPYEPHACTCGSEDLEECDEEPLRHQTVDIPEIKPTVIEYVQYIRQICWAHLKRDFKAISEAGGKLGKIGLELHELARQILKMRARVRDGTLLWKTFQRRMPELQKQVESLLQAGARFDGKLGGKCRKILKT